MTDRRGVCELVDEASGCDVDVMELIEFVAGPGVGGGGGGDAIGANSFFVDSEVIQFAMVHAVKKALATSVQSNGAWVWAIAATTWSDAK